MPETSGGAKYIYYVFSYLYVPMINYVTMITNNKIEQLRQYTVIQVM